MVLILYARMSDELDQATAAAGSVRLTWFDVLATLNSAGGRRMRLRDLADAVLLTRAGLTRVLDRMEDEGLVRREACPGDGRGSDAVLTDAGFAAVRQAWPVFMQVLQKRFAAHLPPASAAAVVGALRPILLANNWLPHDRPVTVTVRRKTGRQSGPPDPHD